MKQFNFSILLILIMVFFSCEKNDTLPLINTSDIEFIQGDICSPKIISYHFGVESLSVSEQISKLLSLGMSGIIIQVETNNDIIKLNEYYANSNVKSGKFEINNIFTTITVKDSLLNRTQLTIIDKIYKKIQNQNTQLQVLFNGNKNDYLNIEKTISNIAIIAKKYNKSVIIYPHYELAIETAEEALYFIEKSINKNVFLAVHLCHELAAGNGNRIRDVVEGVSPYIKFISISGASLSEKSNDNLPSWFWGIKPLSMGDYDYNSFILSLKDNYYKGPIAIHTWGILNNFELSVEEHLPESKKIIEMISGELCN